MDERPFLDRSIKPTPHTLQAVLGSTNTHFNKIISLVSAYSKEWTFSKSGGWMLKIYDRHKALLYLIPMNNGFKISLAIRENERAAFLGDDELGMMHAKISGSKKNIEGFALQFEVANKNEFQSLELFVRKLIAIRL